MRTDRLHDDRRPEEGQRSHHCCDERDNQRIGTRWHDR
jgi:hypothetical protein